MRPYRLRLAGLGLVALMAGCDWLVPFVFLAPETKEVPPEYARLSGQEVLVMVWAEPETLYDYPHIRLELASFIGDKIQAEVEGVQVVDSRKVEAFIERTAEAAYSPRMTGEHFGVDTVVYVELLEFQIRDPDSPDFLQGQVQASVGVHDLRAGLDDPDFQELEQVTTVHPEHPVWFSPSAHELVRNEVYAKFAEGVARKFYPHEEKIDYGD